MENQLRLIKKYPNRRLYDTKTSSYITLADVKQMVLKQEEFQVVDAKSGDDLTRQILLQIILEEESGGVPMFSSDLLSQMIRSYGNAMQGMMGSYLERNMRAFQDIQKALQEQSQKMYGDNFARLARAVGAVHEPAGPGDAEPDAGLHGAEPEGVRAVPGADTEPARQACSRA
jgi:polyhydroxyalkanoate synthesis repressor PhaR